LPHVIARACVLSWTGVLVVEVLVSLWDASERYLSVTGSYGVLGGRVRGTHHHFGEYVEEHTCFVQRSVDCRTGFFDEGCELGSCARASRSAWASAISCSFCAYVRILRRFCEYGSVIGIPLRWVVNKTENCWRFSLIQPLTTVSGERLIFSSTAIASCVMVPNEHIPFGRFRWHFPLSMDFAS
jgi:hypothetical protein